MPLQNVPTLETSVVVAAPPARVWELVSDLRNMSRWSPQTAKSLVRGGRVDGRVGLGTRLMNLNRRGFLVWPTQSQVVRFVPEQEIAFRIKENFTVWSYVLEPVEGGTRLTSRREAPEGISDVSVRLTRAAFGGVESFAAELERGMEQTLQRIKADVEGP